MADVNLTPLQPPRKWLEDPEVSRNVQDLYFSLYQLFQRTGGGEDIISDLESRVAANELAIAILEAAVIQLDVRVSDNTDSIVSLEGRVEQNELDIAQLFLDVLGLKQTFSWKSIPSGEDVTIAENQQMIVVDGIDIQGNLILEGDLALI